MATKKVYVIICKSGMTLFVNVDGKQVPMEEFLQTHTPIQVTGLTPYNPSTSLDNVGLMIAEETEQPPTGLGWTR